MRRLAGSAAAWAAAALLCLPATVPFAFTPALLAGSGRLRQSSSGVHRLRARTCIVRMVAQEGDSDAPKKSGTQFFSVERPRNGLRSIEAELEFRFGPSCAVGLCLASLILFRFSVTGRWHITTRWVGSLVPSEWMEGREYSAAGSDLSVGDLVVVPRTDGTLRFGEVVSIDASRICQVLLHCKFPTSSAHVLLFLHPSQSLT